jgi:hypothetical protein
VSGCGRLMAATNVKELTLPLNGDQERGIAGVCRLMADQGLCPGCQQMSACSQSVTARILAECIP